jgi:hypothetical protein
MLDKRISGSFLFALLRAVTADFQTRTHRERQDFSVGENAPGEPLIPRCPYRWRCDCHRECGRGEEMPDLEHREYPWGRPGIPFARVVASLACRSCRRGAHGRGLRH